MAKSWPAVAPCTVAALATFWLTSVPSGPVRLDFVPEVQNVPVARHRLEGRPSTVASYCPALRGDVRYGFIPIGPVRSTAGDRPHGLFVAVAQDQSAPPRLFVDRNLDGAVGCEESFETLPHPGRAGAFLRTMPLPPALPDSPRVRFVVSGGAAPDERGAVEVELVDVPTSRTPIGGRPATWLLVDGNLDGVFDGGFGDALLASLDSNVPVSLDPYAGSRLPFGAVLHLADAAYRLESVDPAGRYAVLPPASPADAALWRRYALGEKPPESACETLDGRTVRVGGERDGFQVIYFWLSTCGRCSEDMQVLAPAVVAARAPGVTLVGVSLDGAVSDYEAFIEAHRPDWPQCRAGARLWDDPMAFRFGVRAGGDFAVLGPDGRIVATGNGHELILSSLDRIGREAPGRSGR
ncbi:MAG: hypothetical protein ACREAA_20870 [Candidatus Polarisedimenticolia bacterium]